MKVISVDLLAHLKKDHPIEGLIAQKFIDSGEWILENEDHGK